MEKSGISACSVRSIVSFRSLLFHIIGYRPDPRRTAAQLLHFILYKRCDYEWLSATIMEDAAVIAVVVATVVTAAVTVAAVRKSGRRSRTTAKSSRSAAAPGKTVNGIRWMKAVPIPGKCASAAIRTASAACILLIAETDSGRTLPIHVGSAARISTAPGNIRDKTYETWLEPVRFKPRFPLLCSKASVLAVGFY